MHFSLTKSSFVVVMAAVILLATTGPALASTRPLLPRRRVSTSVFPSALSRYLRRPALASWRERGHDLQRKPMSRPRAHLGQWRRQRDTRLLRQHRKSRPGERLELADEPTDARETVPAPTPSRAPTTTAGTRRESLRERRQRESDDGASSPTASAIAAPWWLDVETGHKWETLQYGRSSATGAYDEASDRRHDRLLSRHRRRVSGSTQRRSSGRHHRPYRVNVPSVRCGSRASVRWRPRRWCDWRHSPAGAWR